jgi:spermidine/putrescine transport system permease protein
MADATREQGTSTKTTDIGTLLLRAYLFFALVALAVPVLFMMWLSFDANQLPSIPVQHYSLHWYEEVWNNPDIREGLSNSLIVGASVSLLSVSFGLLSAYLLCRRFSKLLSPFYVAFISLPCFVPLLLAGMAMLMYFQTIQLSGNILAIIAAHTCYCSPFALSLIRLSYERLNPELEYAARNLGAGNIRLIASVIVPQLWPAIAAAAMLSFLVSWDEFVMSWFVGGFTKTLPMVLYDMIGSSYSPSINAIGTAVTLISGLVLLAVLLLVQRAQRVKGVRQ